MAELKQTEAHVYVGNIIAGQRLFCRSGCDPDSVFDLEMVCAGQSSEGLVCVFTETSCVQRH